MTFWSMDIKQRWQRVGKSFSPQNEDAKLEPIQLEHLAISFAILGCGLFISCLVFIWEIRSSLKSLQHEKTKDVDSENQRVIKDDRSDSVGEFNSEDNLIF